MASTRKKTMWGTIAHKPIERFSIPHALTLLGLPTDRLEHHKTPQGLRAARRRARRPYGHPRVWAREQDALPALAALMTRLCPQPLQEIPHALPHTHTHAGPRIGAYEQAKQFLQLHGVEREPWPSPRPWMLPVGGDACVRAPASVGRETAFVSPPYRSCRPWTSPRVWRPPAGMAPPPNDPQGCGGRGLWPGPASLRHGTPGGVERLQGEALVQTEVVGSARLWRGWQGSAHGVTPRRDAARVAGKASRLARRARRGFCSSQAGRSPARLHAVACARARGRAPRRAEDGRGGDSSAPKGSEV
jgi:hypothetical protein